MASAADTTMATVQVAAHNSARVPVRSERKAGSNGVPMRGRPPGVDAAINEDCVRLVGGIGYSRESGRLQWSTPAAVMHGGRPDATPTLESFVELHL
jgi:hypothetical protein